MVFSITSGIMKMVFKIAGDFKQSSKLRRHDNWRLKTELKTRRQWNINSHRVLAGNRELIGSVVTCLNVHPIAVTFMRIVQKWGLKLCTKGQLLYVNIKCRAA